MKMASYWDKWFCFGYCLPQRRAFKQKSGIIRVCLEWSDVFFSVKGFVIILEDHRTIACINFTQMVQIYTCMHARMNLRMLIKRSDGLN